MIIFYILAVVLFIVMVWELVYGLIIEPIYDMIIIKGYENGKVEFFEGKPYWKN